MVLSTLSSLLVIAGSASAAQQTFASTWPDTSVHIALRNVLYFMDNCAGTNKSQYCFGALALAVALAVVDVIAIQFMVPGHTKFECDKAARNTAGAYQRADVYNHAMLLEVFKPYVCARGYDGDMLSLFRDVTPHIFGPIPGISSMRSFMIVGDDGQLGDDLELVDVSVPSGEVTAASLKDAVRKLARRSAKVLIRRFLRRRMPTYGLGSGANLLPSTAEEAVFPVRHVRLFCQESEADTTFQEIKNWHKRGCRDTVSVFHHLSKLQPFNQAPEDAPGKKGHEAPYGSMATHFEEHYKYYVPVRYAPDNYDVAADGATGLGSDAYLNCLSAGDQERIKNAKDRAAAEAAVSAAQELLRRLEKERDAEAARVAAEAAAGALRELGIEVELVTAPAATNTTVERRYNADRDDGEVRRLWTAPDAPPADPGPKRNDQMRRKAIAAAMNLTLAQVTRAVDKLGLKIP